MAQTEEWILRLVDQSSGQALKIASGLAALDHAQIKAAISSARLAGIQQKNTNDQSKANVGGMAAMAKILDNKHKADAAVDLAAAKASGELAKAKLVEAKAVSVAAKEADRAAKVAKSSAAGDPLKAVNAGADKLITKKAAIKDVLGGAIGGGLAAMKDIGGPLGLVAGQIEEIAGAVGRLGPAGAAALYAFKAIVYVVTAGAVALAAMAAAAILVTNQRAQLLATFGALSGGGTGGAKTLAIVEKLGTALPFATSKIAEWATTFQKANLQGKALEGAIKAAAAATALMGDSGGAAVTSFITTLAQGGAAAASLIATIKRGGPEARSQLAEMGLRTEDLAAALGMTSAQFRNARLSAKQLAEAVEKALARKAAGPLADLMLTFPSILGKAKEGFLSLFDKLGPAVRPFMGAVKDLFGLFNKGGAAITFLKPIVTSVMTTAFSWATKAVTAIKAIALWFMASGKAGGFFSGVVGVLKTGWAALVTIFGAVKVAMAPVVAILKAIFSNAMVMKGIKTIFTVIAAVVVGLVVAVAALAAAFATIAGAVAAAFGAVVGVIMNTIGATADLGSQIIDGIVNGLDPSAFVAKMAGMASAGLAAFAGIFGIKSPSRVMLKHGKENIAGAAATGVDQGADKMDAAMEGLGGGKPGGGGKSKKGNTLIMHNPVFGAGITRDQVEEWFLEAMAGWRGEAPEPAPS